MKKISLFVSLLLLCTIVFSQSDPEIFKLTANHVENFLEEFPDLYKEFEKLGVKYNQDDGEFALPEAVSEMNKINAVCKKHGYNDYTDFITQTSSILMAYAVVASENSMDESSVEIKAAIKKINDDESMTTEQKQIAVQQLEASLTLMNTYAKNMSSSANIAVVEQYSAKLKVLLEDFE